MHGSHICLHCGKLVPNYIEDIRLVHICDRDPKLDYTSEIAYEISLKKVYG